MGALTVKNSRCAIVFTRTTAFVLLVIWLPACAYRWRAETADPRVAIRSLQPDQARVTLTDGRQIILRNPTVTEDSIVGIVHATQYTASGVIIPIGSRLALAPGEVTNLEIRELDKERSGTMIGVPLLVVAVGGMFLLLNAYRNAWCGKGGFECR